MESNRGYTTQQMGSRESMNGDQGSLIRKVEGVVDEAKREVLKMCAIAWCKGSLQEVDVVHSHDLICHCEDSDTVVSREDNQGAHDKIQAVRDNPIYVPVEVASSAIMGRVGMNGWGV
ncbi:hypothetical protein V6N13_125080 [Hibiscus sabdariffa]